MNRKEWLLTKVNTKEFWQPYNECRLFYEKRIQEMKKERPHSKVVLHHILCKYNDKNYEEWNPEYIIPMFNEDHSAYHKQKMSEETKQKIGLSHKGRKHSEETKQKISDSTKKVIHTKEWCENMGKALKDKKKSYKSHPCSEETKQKIRETLMNKKLSLSGSTTRRKPYT